MPKPQNIKHTDPAYMRWKKKHPKFPGVEECLSMMWAHNTSGALREVIYRELICEARTRIPEFISAYENCKTYHMRASLIHAIDEAEAYSAVDFLEKIAATAPELEATLAFNTLRNWNTKETQAALRRLEWRKANSV